MIKGEIITLRPAAIHDRRNIYNWLAQSDTTANMMGLPHFPDNPVPTWKEFDSDYDLYFFNDIDPDQGRSYIIEKDGEPVGHINYNEVDRANSCVELDIWLAGSKHCNRGYGPDAINTLCRYLGEQLNISTVFLAPSARNKAAVRAYEKCGFRSTGWVPANFIPDYPDAVVLVRALNVG